MYHLHSTINTSETVTRNFVWPQNQSTTESYRDFSSWFLKETKGFTEKHQPFS